MTAALFALGLTFNALGVNPQSGAAGKAEPWIGRDASDLLLELRVDGGRVQIVEDDAAMETRYMWRTVTTAWTERIHVSGGEFLGLRIQPNGQIPEYSPIVYEETHHPEKHRCDVTYVADREGVIRRFELKGPECDADVIGPKEA